MKKPLAFDELEQVKGGLTIHPSIVTTDLKETDIQNEAIKPSPTAIRNKNPWFKKKTR